MATVAEVAPGAPATRPPEDVLRRADGIELIGEFEDSGFVEPPHLARRADGQVVQLSELLYAVARAAGSTPALPKREPLMALRHRRPLLSERVVNPIAWLLTWLHLPPVVAPVLLALGAFDLWLFAIHGIAGGVRSVIYDPVLLLAVFASV